MISLRQYGINIFKRMIPAFLLFLVLIFIYKTIPTFNPVKPTYVLNPNVDPVTGSVVKTGLFFMFLSTAAVASVISFWKERRLKKIDDSVGQVYSSPKYILVKILAFYTGITISSIVILLINSILLIIQHVEVRYFLLLILSSSKDILWCLLLYLVFCICYLITGRLFIPIALGMTILFSYFLLYAWATFAGAGTVFLYKITKFIEFNFDITWFPHLKMHLVLLIIIGILIVITIMLYRKYPVQKIGNAFVYRPIRYAFIFIVIMILRQQVFSHFLNDHRGSITLHILLYYIVFICISYWILYLLTGLGKSKPYKMNYKQIIISLVIVSILVGWSIVDRNEINYPRYIRFFDRNFNTEKLIETDSYKVILSNILPRKCEYEIKEEDDTVSIKFYKKPEHRLVNFNVFSLVDPTTASARAVIIMKSHSEIESVVFYYQRDDGSFFERIYNKDEIENYAGMSLGEICVNTENYFDWYEIFSGYDLAKASD